MAVEAPAVHNGEAVGLILMSPHIRRGLLWKKGGVVRPSSCRLADRFILAAHAGHRALYYQDYHNEN